MRAAVTGGAGFIGSHVVDALIDAGSDVLVVDNLVSGRIANVERALERSAEFVEVDIRHADAVTAAFAGFRPEVVFHLAAQIDVRASMAEPAFDASVNVLGSINVFAAAAATGVRRVVNTSTGGAIYGDDAPIPTPETLPPRPSSAYGLSKWVAEQYGDWFRRSRGLDVVTLRYGNVYGPRQDPHGDAGVIALFGRRLLTGEAPTIYGDGRQTRDFVFVGDIAAANLAAARADDLGHRAYNIGSGVEVSVLELVDAMTTAADLPPGRVRPTFAPARPGEVRRSCLDVDRAAELRADPITSLADGLALTLEWLRNETRPETRNDAGTRSGARHRG